MTTVVRTGIIVEGGSLKHPWALPTDAIETVGDRSFFLASRADRQFAAFLGLSMSARSPWQANPSLDYLCDLRNSAVEEHLSKSWADEADPAADFVQLPKRPRRELCEKLPEFLTIRIPGDGQLRQSHDMNVLPASSKQSVFAFEITQANFEAVRQLCANPPDSAQRRWATRSSGKYKDEFPNVSLLKSGDNWIMVARVGENRHSKTVPPTDDPETWQRLADELARELQNWYDRESADAGSPGARASH